MQDTTTPSPTALVTGASTGIGFAYAKHLAAKGYSLILASQDASRLRSAALVLGDSVLASHAINLSERSGVERLIQQMPVPEVIVANAGITLHGVVGSIPQLERDRLFYLLCGGAIDLLEALVPAMLERRHGRVVIVSSIGALTPMRKSAHYASAKAAIARYGDSLAEEVSESGVSVTVSLPGYVRTHAHERAGLGHLNKQIPSWMWLTPEQMVLETEQASLRGQRQIIPGRVYRWVRPFLGSRLANQIWRRLSNRRADRSSG